MRCWSARRRLADHLEGTLAGPTRAAMEEHLASCARCRGERARQEGVAHLLREAAGPAPPAPDADLFERRVMAAARTAPRRPFGPDGLWKPVPLAAALSLMIVGGLAGLWLSGAGREIDDPSGTPEIASAARWSDAGEPTIGDRPFAIAAASDEAEIGTPDEIVFSLRQDLVGLRRGRIPLTAYVLEPPPAEPAVVRASY